MEKTKQMSSKGLIILILCIVTWLPVAAQFKVVGYMPSWSGSVSSVQYSKLTHINYAFILPTNTGGLGALDNPSKLTSLVSSAHANGVKVLISVGGWNDGNDGAFESFAANSTYRTNFVNNIINLVTQYNLDGADIDWEYPDAGASANNYAALMQQLSTALHSRGKELTAAVVGDGGDGILSSVFAYVDNLNLMAYDYNNYQHSTYNYAVQSINYWKGRGLPASKTVLGVPFYSRPNDESFASLIARGADPYADTYSGQGYNGITTIKSKTNLAFDQGGGIMMWELSQDATGMYSLLTAIDQVVKVRGGGNNQAPTASITSPANGSTFTAPATVNITANATDGDGTIAKVEFFQGATKLGEDLSSPYSFSWTNVAAGTYSLTARSTDNKGAATTSSAVSITVNGTGAPNLALNKTVTVSSTETTGFEGSKAVDGNTTTRWSSAYSDPQFMYVDLGASYSVSQIKITWEAAYGKDYQIQLSPDASTWTTIKTITGNTTLVNNHTALAGSGRYVRINGTARGTVYGYSIFELEVYGMPATGNQSPTVNITSPANGASYTVPATVTINATASDADGTITKVEFYNGSGKLGEDISSPYSYQLTGLTAGTYVLTAKATDDKGATTTSSQVSITVSGTTTTNLALNKPTTISSIEAAGFEGAKAVDGSASTRWASLEGSDPQWIYVDLVATYNINRVKITWEDAYGKDYQVQISSNASTWTSLKSVTGNTSLVNDHTGLSGSGRYVRINGTARGTQWGYSIFELEIYGTATTAKRMIYDAESAMISFPNPVEGKVTIIVPQHLQKDGKITMIDRQGRIVIKETVSSAQHTLDMSHIPSGLYIVHIKNKAGSSLQRIIKN